MITSRRHDFACSNSVTPIAQALRLKATKRERLGQARATTDNPTAIMRRKGWLPTNAPIDSFNCVLLRTPNAIARAATATGSSVIVPLVIETTRRTHRSARECPLTRRHKDVPTALRNGCQEFRHGKPQATGVLALF